MANKPLFIASFQPELPPTPDGRGQKDQNKSFSAGAALAIKEGKQCIATAIGWVCIGIVMLMAFSTALLCELIFLFVPKPSTEL